MSENVLKASSTFRERKESFDKITSREIQKKFPLPFEGGGRDKERKKERKKERYLVVGVGGLQREKKIELNNSLNNLKLNFVQIKDNVDTAHSAFKRNIFFILAIILQLMHSHFIFKTVKLGKISNDATFCILAASKKSDV